MKKDFKKWMGQKAGIHNKIGDIKEDEFVKIKEALIALLK